MVVVSRKVQVGQWVGCPITGQLGQVQCLPFLADMGGQVDTFTYVEYPDGLFAVRLAEIVL